MGSAARRLVFAIGNPSRGDDALGPLCLERIGDLGLPDAELLTDFQLQIEHALDLKDRDEVIFVDATVAGEAPFCVQSISAAQDNSYTSHALSPQALLAAYQTHYGEAAPAAYLLAIRGYRFELGENLSREAARNLEAACAWLAGRLHGRAAQS